MQEVNTYHSSLGATPESVMLCSPFCSQGEGGSVVADSVQTRQEGTANMVIEEEAEVQRSRNSYRHQRVEVDTLPPDPREMKPFAPGTPLTMKPEILEGDYWKDGLVHLQKGAFMQELDSVCGPIPDSCRALIKPQGMAGDPVPYLFRTDSLVTIVLMVSFFLVVWVISRSRHYLREQVKDFFHHRQRENLFAQRTQTELRGQVFLIFQTCFVLGVLFFDYTQEFQVEVFNQVSPYLILATSVAIFCLYYVLKIGTYSVVNNIFFDRRQCEQWNGAYLLCVLALGLVLVPLALLVVYFDMNFRNTAILFICFLIVDKMLLFYKCSRIFFSYPFGWVHLFLYFCTLEIAPIFMLFRVQTYVNNLLLTIN